MKEDLKEIRNIENKYGLVLFRMGLSHLVDVGHRNLTDENVEESVQQIMAQGEEDKANGKIPIMTPEFQCEILHEKNNNDVVAEYNSKRCTAIFNPFVCLYYVDDIYSILRNQQKCPTCGEIIPDTNLERSLTI